MLAVLGSLGVITSILLGLALWRGRQPTQEKIAAELGFLVFQTVLILCAGVAAAFAVAQVRNSRLDFFFCGIRTQSFQLDGQTTFTLSKIGRIETVVIKRGSRWYVPNGALDKKAIVNLLRTNGVAEQPTKTQSQEIIDLLHTHVVVEQQVKKESSEGPQ